MLTIKARISSQLCKSRRASAADADRFWPCSTVPNSSGRCGSLIADADVSPLENLVSYLGVDGMAEEWWSTISQRSPFLT
jgi:hypothetical protein